MGLFLKNFENHTQYDNYINGSGAILPNVSICTTEGDVHYNPLTPTPPTPSHDYVEIGGVKWATMNVGANSITDTGLYFQWGDTQGYTAAQCGRGAGQKIFLWADYKYTTNGNWRGANKYQVADGETEGIWYDGNGNFIGDNKTMLEPSDDAVTAAWGGNWRMPTKAEFAALSAAVNTVWTDSYQGSGVAGIVCTDKTDSSKVLFFPAAGYCSNGIIADVSYGGHYHTSSLHDNDTTRNYRLEFYDSDIYWDDDDTRSNGLSVRGVLDE